MSVAGGSFGPPAASPDRKGRRVQRYTVRVNGLLTTLRLSDEDARKRGLSVPEPAREPDPVIGDDTDGEDTVAAKAFRPANKSRRPANKRRAAAAAGAFTPKGE